MLLFAFRVDGRFRDRFPGAPDVRGQVDVAFLVNLADHAADPADAAGLCGRDAGRGHGRFLKVVDVRRRRVCAGLAEAERRCDRGVSGRYGLIAGPVAVKTGVVVPEVDIEIVIVLMLLRPCDGQEREALMLVVLQHVEDDLIGVTDLERRAEVALGAVRRLDAVVDAAVVHRFHRGGERTVPVGVLNVLVAGVELPDVFIFGRAAVRLEIRLAAVDRHDRLEERAVRPYAVVGKRPGLKTDRVEGGGGQPLCGAAELFIRIDVYFAGLDIDENVGEVESAVPARAVLTDGVNADVLIFARIGHAHGITVVRGAGVLALRAQPGPGGSGQGVVVGGDDREFVETVGRSVAVDLEAVDRILTA